MSDTIYTTLFPDVVPALSVLNFRILFPEFSDSSVYFDEVIEPWLILGTQLLNPTRWGVLYTTGIGLFTAHEVVLQRQAQIAASRGSVPGTSFGMIASKSINGVSVSYNLMNVGLDKGGDWNLTTYGIRFLRFARMMGAGGIQVVGSDASQVSEAQLMTRSLFSFPNF